MPSNHFSVVFKTTHARTNQRWTNDTKRFRRLVCFEEEKAERPLAAPFCSSVDTPTTKCSFFFFFFFWRTPPPILPPAHQRKKRKKREKKSHPLILPLRFEAFELRGEEEKKFPYFLWVFFFCFPKNFECLLRSAVKVLVFQTILPSQA